MVSNRYGFRSELRGRGATGQAKPKSFCVMADEREECRGCGWKYSRDIWLAIVTRSRYRDKYKDRVI
jgi:hypothetical protein